MFSLGLLVLFSVRCALAQSELRVLHRVLHPSSPDASFTHRALLSLDGPGPAHTARLVPSETFNEDLLQISAQALGLKDALYQVALEHSGDPDPSYWAISSVPACHLASSTSESFTLHLDQHGAAFGLDYFVAPVPHDGACPAKRRRAASPAEAAPMRVANTTVVLRSPSFPPLPQLRVPPPVTPEGQPVAAPVEKTFFEKYWMYMAMFMLFLVFAPAGGPEEGAAPAGK